MVYLRGINTTITMKPLDLSLLRARLKVMTRRSSLFRVLKEELLMQGYWKNLPRGKPSAKYFGGKNETN